MTVLVRSGSPLNPQGTPILVVTLKRRRCARCDRPAHVTLWSPSTAIECAWRGSGDGQCCIRCTREMRS